jgi:hypothetical protein
MRVVMAADIAGWRRGNPDRVPRLPKRLRRAALAIPPNDGIYYVI